MIIIKSNFYNSYSIYGYGRIIVNVVLIIKVMLSILGVDYAKTSDYFYC